jgi:spore coat polysaccharide biosynthesis protein SpsF
MRKLVASLACRAGGSRLYGKPLQLLDIEGGLTVLDYLIRQLSTEAALAECVLAVADGPENEPFHSIGAEHGLRTLRGDETDVLGRHLLTAELTGATDIFIVTTESPFTFFEAIDEAWRTHRENGNDVTATDDLPEGSAFSIFTVETLRRSHRLGEDRHRSEFISLYVRDHIQDFQLELVGVPPYVRRPDIRLTIDYPEDLVLCRGVYERFVDLAPRIPVADIVEFLDATPRLVDLVKPYAQPERLYSE